MIPKPPDPILIDGKEYYEAEPMKSHLRHLRADLARAQYAAADFREQAATARNDATYWKLKALGPR
jgi:hypothetical protein